MTIISTKCFTSTRSYTKDLIKVYNCEITNGHPHRESTKPKSSIKTFKITIHSPPSLSDTYARISNPSATISISTLPQRACSYNLQSPSSNCHSPRFLVSLCPRSSCRWLRHSHISGGRSSGTTISRRLVQSVCT